MSDKYITIMGCSTALKLEIHVKCDQTIWCCSAYSFSILCGEEDKAHGSERFLPSDSGVLAKCTALN